MKRIVTLIDGNYLMIRASHTGKHLETPTGYKTGGLHIFLNSLFNFKNKYGFPVVFFDSGKSERRKSIFSDYKKREKIEYKEILDLNSPEEVFIDAGYSSKKEGIEKIHIKETMSFGFNMAPKFLKNLGIPVVKKDTPREADDLIMFYAKYFSKSDIKVTCISDDDDYLQMLDDNINVYAPMKEKLWTVDTYLNEKGFLPKYHSWFKSLLGDSSDNISGVKGYGEVRSIKLLIDFLYEYKNSNNIEDFKDFLSKDKKYINLLNNFNIFERNLDLIDIEKEISNWNFNEILDNNELTPILNKTFIKDFIDNFQLNQQNKWFDFIENYNNPFKELKYV